MKLCKYVVIFFLCSCANVITPSGGPKDVTPPKLINVYPKNKSIEFNDVDIVFYFDERIQINSKENIYFSPYFDKVPKLDINKNKLKLTFNEKLKDSTTYLLSLNELIKDVNEGNVVENLNYLFSTGKTIDTLSIYGILLDAKTSKPMINTWVYLHDNDEDSVLYKKTPNYITKSNKTGAFSFSNLTKKSYYIYALEDKDNNLRFTIPNEKVGFYDKEVSTNSSKIEIRLFDETALADTVKLTARDSSLVGYGKLIVDSLPSNPLVLELLKDDGVIRRIKATQKTSIDSLEAGVYSLRVIEDENQNGIWDTGKLIHKRAAEKVWLYPKEINIRDNWDVVIEWKTNQ